MPKEVVKTSPVKAAVEEEVKPLSKGDVISTETYKRNYGSLGVAVISMGD